MEVDEIPADLPELRQAVIDVKTKLKTRPKEEELLILYGLFKQSLKGDNTAEKPGMFDLKARYKWSAWSENKGMSQKDAQAKYIAYVQELVKKYA